MGIEDRESSENARQSGTGQRPGHHHHPDTPRNDGTAPLVARYDGMEQVTAPTAIPVPTSPGLAPPSSAPTFVANMLNATLRPRRPTRCQPGTTQAHRARLPPHVRHRRRDRRPARAHRRPPARSSQPEHHTGLPGRLSRRPRRTATASSSTDAVRYGPKPSTANPPMTNGANSSNTSNYARSNSAPAPGPTPLPPRTRPVDRNSGTFLASRNVNAT